MFGSVADMTAQVCAHVKKELKHQRLHQRTSPPETYSALINARLPFMEIDFGIHGFRDSWYNMEISAGHLERRLNICNLGRTFGISAGRSKFRPDGRNLSRTFEISAGRSQSRLDVPNLGQKFGKMKIKNSSLGLQNGLPEVLVEANWIFRK